MNIKNKSLFLILSLISLHAMAGGIPAGAKTRLELDCNAKLSGKYSKVTKIIIRDVTYKTPPATWDNNSSVLDVTLADGTVQEGVMNESNGNDPQDYRDSDPIEYGGTGGTGMYFNANDRLLFVTHGTSNQKGLPSRIYSLDISQVDNSGNLIQALSKGQLSCTAKQGLLN